MAKLLAYRMGMTLPLAQVSRRVRCRPQLENKLQGFGPARIAGLVESRWHKAAGRNLAQLAARSVGKP